MRKGLYGLLVGATMMGAANASYAQNVSLHAFPEGVQQVYQGAESCKDVSGETLAALFKPEIRLVEPSAITSKQAIKEFPLVFPYSANTTSKDKLALAGRYRNRDSDLIKQIDEQIKEDTLFPQFTMEQFYKFIKDNNFEDRLDQDRGRRADREAAMLEKDFYTAKLPSRFVDDHLIDIRPFKHGNLTIDKALDLKDMTLTGEWKCVDIPNKDTLRQDISDEYQKMGEKKFSEKYDAASLVPFALVPFMAKDENFILIYDIE